MANNMTDTERIINRFVMEWNEMRLKTNTVDKTQVMINTLISEEGRVILRNLTNKLQGVMANNEKFKEMRNTMDVFRMMDQLSSADSETVSNMVNNMSNSEENNEEQTEVNTTTKDENNEQYDEAVYPDEYEKHEDN